MITDHRFYNRRSDNWYLIHIPNFKQFNIDTADISSKPQTGCSPMKPGVIMTAAFQLRMFVWCVASYLAQFTQLPTVHSDYFDHRTAQCTHRYTCILYRVHTVNVILGPEWTISCTMGYFPSVDRLGLGLGLQTMLGSATLAQSQK